MLSLEKLRLSQPTAAVSSPVSDSVLGASVHAKVDDGGILYDPLFESYANEYDLNSQMYTWFSQILDGILSRSMIIINSERNSYLCADDETRTSKYFEKPDFALCHRALIIERSPPARYAVPTCFYGIPSHVPLVEMLIAGKEGNRYLNDSQIGALYRYLLHLIQHYKHPCPRGIVYNSYEVSLFRVSSPELRNFRFSHYSVFLECS